MTVFSNLLEMNNAPGIQFLQQQDIPLSQDILSSLEQYGLYLISVLGQQESEIKKITWNTSNICECTLSFLSVHYIPRRKACVSVRVVCVSSVGVCT